MSKRIAAIVWAPEEERTASFARHLQADLHNIHYLLYKRPFVAPFKYVLQSIKTWQVLLRDRPDVIYVTNPPVFAALNVMLYTRVSRAAFIMDTHPPSLYSKKWGWTTPLQRFVSRFALVNVLDQKRYADLFEAWGSPALVLPNPLDRIEAPAGLNGQGETFDVAVVNTFAEDEPLAPILEAAADLPGVRFLITGDLAKAKPGTVENAPPNAQFVGYLRGDDYWNMLHGANAVMALTTFPYSLLGAGTDGVRVGKPLILSDQPVLRDFFTSGTVFVPNTAEGIMQGVRQARAEEAVLTEGIHRLIDEKQHEWETNFADLLARIEAIT